MLGLAVVEGATWWANQRPGRDEYPRRLPEFQTLGWAGHPQLVIDYVNTFARVGERRAG